MVKPTWALAIALPQTRQLGGVVYLFAAAPATLARPGNSNVANRIEGGEGSGRHPAVLLGGVAAPVTAWAGAPGAAPAQVLTTT